MEDDSGLDSYIASLLTDSPAPTATVKSNKVKTKKKQKKKKQLVDVENKIELRCRTPDLLSDLDLSFNDSPVFRPVLNDVNHKIAPRDFQSLAVDEDLLKALNDLELNGSEFVNHTSDDDHLMRALSDLDDSPITVKKCPKSKVQSSKKKTKTKKRLLRPVGSTSTPNNTHDSPQVGENQACAVVQNVQISSAENSVCLRYSQSVQSAELFSSISESDSRVKSCRELPAVKMDCCTDSAMVVESNVPCSKAISPLVLDLPDLSLGSFDSKSSSPRFSSTRRSLCGDSSLDLIEMSRISKFFSELNSSSASNDMKVSGTQFLESSDEVKKRGMVNSNLDDTEILESSGERLIRKPTVLSSVPEVDDSSISLSARESPKDAVAVGTTQDVELKSEAGSATLDDTEILETEEDRNDNNIKSVTWKLCRVGVQARLDDSASENGVENQVADVRTCAVESLDGSAPHVEAENYLEKSVQVDFDSSSSKSDDSLSNDDESFDKAELSAKKVLKETPGVDHDRPCADSPEVIAIPQRLSFSESPLVAETRRSQLCCKECCNDPCRCGIAESFGTTSNQERIKSSIDNVDQEHKHWRNETERNESLQRYRRRDSSSDSDDEFEKFLAKVNNKDRDEIVEDEEEERLSDFIVSDNEEVVCISSDDSDTDNDELRNEKPPPNPYLTPPEYLSTSPELPDIETETYSDHSVFPNTPRDQRLPKTPLTKTVYKTPKETSVNFSSSDSDEDFVDSRTTTWDSIRRPPPLLRSNSATDNVLSTPSASAVPESIRQRGGKTVSSIQMGKLPASHQHYDFLKSLGKEVTPTKIHPEALKFVRNFKHTRDELSQKLLRIYNEQVFENKLRDVAVIWNNRLLKTAGYCVSSSDRTTKQHTARIELSTKVCDSAERVRDTLLHELCHAATWIIDQRRDGHGPFWKRWARLAHLAFPQLPVVSRCHSYYIETKYIYRCQKCGYSINRHSKSLNTERKVCGYCKGDFDLYSRNKDGSLSLVSADCGKTPLNKFAQFVKDNYSSVKSSCKTKKHRDVMKMLSAEFAEKNRIK